MRWGRGDLLPTLFILLIFPLLLLLRSRFLRPSLELRRRTKAGMSVEPAALSTSPSSSSASSARTSSSLRKMAIRSEKLIRPSPCPSSSNHFAACSRDRGRSTRVVGGAAVRRCGYTLPLARLSARWSSHARSSKLEAQSSGRA